MAHALVSIAEAIDHAHTYLAEQQAALDEAQFRIVLASNCRQLRVRIETSSDPINQDSATQLLETIRGGPWSGAQTQVLAMALETAQRNTEQHETISVERKPQTLSYPELFWSDHMWQRCHDVSKNRR